LFTRRFLYDLRIKALKKGIWYKTTSRLERGIINLSIKILDKVKSSALGIEIVNIVANLKKMLKSPFLKHMETYGIKQASKIAEYASILGYNGAKSLFHDNDYVRYITLLDYYNPLKGKINN
jgi:hypothetical protein